MSIDDFDNRYDFSSIDELNQTSRGPSFSAVTRQPSRGRSISNGIESILEEFQLNSLDADDYPGARRPIPVSTVDWTSTDRSQFIPVSGLDFLIGINTILIQQTVELNDMVSQIEAENRYILKIPEGETLYMAKEESAPIQRLFCGSKRSFHMSLSDHTRQQALLLRRRTAFSMCCVPCVIQDIDVVVPPGEYLGKVRQEWTLSENLFLVKNFNDDVLYVIKGPNRNICCPVMEAEFRILSADNLVQLGTINHGWDIQSTNYNMVITFPNSAADPKIKALLIAAAFLLEYVYFVAPKSTKRCNCC